jgi:hypothetical protein
MRAIFISYRHDDSEGQAGRLFDDLEREFGRDAVFMDVTAIEPGRDFRRAIDEHVASCGVLLCVIGRYWLTLRDETGRRRIDEAADFVRLETASALRRDIPVVPVLVHGAAMPTADELPEDLRGLAFRHAMQLTHAHWDSDMQVLIGALSRQLSPTRPTAAARHLPLAGPGGHARQRWHFSASPSRSRRLSRCRFASRVMRRQQQTNRPQHEKRPHQELLRQKRLHARFNRVRRRLARRLHGHCRHVRAWQAAGRPQLPRGARPSLPTMVGIWKPCATPGCCTGSGAPIPTRSRRVPRPTLLRRPPLTAAARPPQPWSVAPDLRGTTPLAPTM